MSLPTFKFTNIGAPTNNESVNSGLSSASKMQKSGIIFDTKSNILSSIKERAQETFKDVKMPEISLDVSESSSSSSDGDDSSSFFSIFTLIKLILIAIIVWFVWSSLSNNGDFHLGMEDIGDKMKTFFKSMEEKGRVVISRMTNTPLPDTETDNHSDSDSDSDSDNENPPKKRHPSAAVAGSSHRPPVPPATTNSSDKKPGFVNDDTKYTFLDKADRSYSGPSPRADDSTSVTQKHQSGKGGYCYIGEDRGFRSCVKVEASDKCMSGQVFSRQDTCVDPTLRE
jgi:hypothetical protein